MSAPSPHLKLDELLAKAGGEAESDLARAHLVACGQCQDDAESWDAVAAGVRHFVATVPVPPWQPAGALAGASAAPPPSLSRYSLSPQGQLRSVLVVAAALALVAGGVSYRLVTGAGGGRKVSSVTAAGLVAVSGCPGLVAALGTAAHVHRASLIVQTPGGQPVMVVTSAATVSHEVPGSVSHLANGGLVFVRGVDAGGKVKAYSVSIGVAPRLPEPRLGRRLPARARPWIGAGIVRDARKGRFTLVTPGGARVPVTAPRSTIVFTLVRADLSRIRAGDYVVAVGRAGPGGTLIAATVQEGPSLPHDRGNGISALGGIGCSPSAIAAAASIS